MAILVSWVRTVLGTVLGPKLGTEVGRVLGWYRRCDFGCNNGRVGSVLGPKLGKELLRVLGRSDGVVKDGISGFRIQ